MVGISAVSQSARDRADAMLPGVPVLDVPTIVERSELVVIAVPADQLPELVSGLAAVGAWQPGQLVAHTAPGLGTEVLSPALAAGAIPLAISPAMAFTGTSIDLVRLRESWCAVTAPGPVLPIAQALVVEMGAEPVVVAGRRSRRLCRSPRRRIRVLDGRRVAGGGHVARSRDRAPGARARVARALLRRERPRRRRIRRCGWTTSRRSRHERRRSLGGGAPRARISVIRYGDSIVQ